MEKEKPRYDNGCGGPIDFKSEGLRGFVHLQFGSLETFLEMLGEEEDNYDKASMGKILLQRIEDRLDKTGKLLEVRLGKIDVDMRNGDWDGEILGLTITPEEKKNGK